MLTHLGQCRGYISRTNLASTGKIDDVTRLDPVDIAIDVANVNTKFIAYDDIAIIDILGLVVDENICIF